MQAWLRKEKEMAEKDAQNLYDHSHRSHPTWHELNKKSMSEAQGGACF